MQGKHDVSLDNVETSMERAFHLLKNRRRLGSGVGALSSSALSSAMACLALYLRLEAGRREFVRSGLEWLARTRNADGGRDDGFGASCFRSAIYSNAFYSLTYPLVALSVYQRSERTL